MHFRVTRFRFICLRARLLALYLRLLKPNGVIAFHVSNHYLALAPVVRQLANEAGYQAVLVTNHEDVDNSVLCLRLGVGDE